MILSGEEILRRLNEGQIFKENTWVEQSVKEASYALRIDNDGLLIDGTFYDPGVAYKGDYIEIEPGKIAILSTKERLNMPDNLVGKIGIRFDPALKGLTGLMGIQVDPLYGQNQDDERLFIRVANLGNETVKFVSEEMVFTFELHEVKGSVQPASPGKDSTWSRIKRQLAGQDHSSWTYVTRVQVENVGTATRLESEIRNINDYLQPLVMFGIFLVAVTILAVALTVILSGLDTPEIYVPRWVTNWGWKVLLGTLSFAAVITGLMGLVTISAMVWRLFTRR